jgi:bifunctional enzyme CysN/CysC
MVRDMLLPGEFIEIYIDTPLAEAERRDVKGLYRKARAGQLANFTGIASPYEPPIAPDIHIDTTTMTAEQAATLIVEHLIGPL